MSTAPVPCQVVGPLAVFDCASNIDRENSASVLESMGSIANKSAEMGEVTTVVFKFSGQSEIEISTLRKMTAPLRALKVAGIKVVALNMSKEMVVRIKSQGLDDLMHAIWQDQVKTGPALIPNRPAPSKTKTLTAEQVVPMMEAVVKTLQMQCQLTFKSLPPQVLNTPQVNSKGIAGITRFKLDDVSGTVALCLPEEIFLMAASALYKKTFTQLEPKLNDVASELLNVIMGLARASLREKGHALSNEIPKVVCPLETAEQLTPLPTVILPFQANTQNVELRIGFDH